MQISGFKLVACGTVLGTFVLLAGGCESAAQKQAKAEKEQVKKEQEQAHKDMLKDSDQWWPSEDGPWKQFADAQAAAGAQADASLSSEHFTGGKLNTLGQEKLKMMMQGGTLPAVVYLGTVDDATANVRRQAIDDFLK